MKEGWEYKKLGELALSMADGPFGSNLKQEHYTNRKEVRIIQLSNIGDEGWRDENTKYTTYEHLETIKRSEVVPGDIVIAKMMPAGRAILCPNRESKYVLSSDAVRVTLKKGLNNRFILFSINSPYFRKQVYENVSGSGRVRTSLTKLRDCKIYLPSFSEQQSIVDYLDSAFAKIDAMKANAEKALDEAKALFQASLKEMLEPKEGWEENTLKNTCIFSQGIQVPLSNQFVKTDNGFTRFLRIVDFTQGNEPPRYVQIVDRKYWLGKDGIAIVRYGASTGYICTGLEGTLANNLFKVTIKDGIKLSSKYLFWWLNSNAFQSVIKKQMNGAAMPAISFGMINDIKMYFPSLQKQQSIVTTLDSLKSKVDRLQENYNKISQECNALKQAILRQVFE